MLVVGGLVWLQCGKRVGRGIAGFERVRSDALRRSGCSIELERGGMAKKWTRQRVGRNLWRRSWAGCDYSRRWIRRAHACARDWSDGRRRVLLDGDESEGR